MGPEEIELKLTVLDLRAVRALVLDPASSIPGLVPLTEARTVDLEDRYLDTADGALREAGLVARIRVGAGRGRLTVKSLARRGEGAVHRRLELEGDADTGDDPRGWPPGRARDLLLDTVGGRALVRLATLRQRRLQRAVAVGTSTVELSLDVIEVVGEGRRAGEGAGRGAGRWVELECELLSGEETDLAALGTTLLRRADLAPSTTSKLERALAAASDAFTKR